MSNMFASMAKKATSLSEILENRTRISTDDIIAQYPTGVTVIEFDIISSNKGTYPVFAIKENPSECFFGGFILAKIADDWAANFDGDIAAASAALKASGGVHMRLYKSRTKDGNNITNVEITD